MTLLKSLRALTVTAVAGLAAAVACAQPYPSKPIRMVVPFAAGGGSDISGRALAKELSAELGQSVVVENRPGASGLLGLDAIAAAAPDGYTLLMFSNTTAVALHYQNKPFDMEKRFIPLGNVLLASMILAVNPKVLDVKNAAELVEHVKAHPAADYTSSGPGSPGNLGMEAMAMQRGLKMTHVPYKGIGPAIVDVLGGRVGILVGDGVAVRPHVASGALRPIANLASFRSPVVPDVPTAVEQGFPQFVNDSLNGLVVPPGTPPAIVERLRAATRRAVASEAYARFAADSGSKNQFIDGPEWGEVLKGDFRRWGEVIKATGITPP